MKVFTKGVLFHIHKYLTRLTLTQTQKSTVQVASYHISSKHWSEQVKEQMTYHNQWTSELTSRAVLWSTVYVAFGQFIYEHSVLKFCIFRPQKKLQKEVIFILVTHCKKLQRLYFNFIHCIYFNIKRTYGRSLFSGLSSFFGDSRLRVLTLLAGFPKRSSRKISYFIM